jgi:hypothetical protein
MSGGIAVKIFSSLDQKDRRMLFLVFGLVVALLVVFAVLTPPEDPNSNPVPDSYLVGRHGAKAAYALLQRSGYRVERWEHPLSELAQQAGPGTTVILASPNSAERQDRAAVVSILNKGGRILATDFRGGELLPGNEVASSDRASFAACEAQPEGLEPLADAGSIWIIPSSTWGNKNPRTRTVYACNGKPVVIEYPVGKGTAVWWSSSTPLENGSIERGHNLELFLNSVGPVQGTQVYWDESLHGAAPTQWNYVKGPVWPLLFWGSIGLGLMMVLSFSRRSGPIRPLPQAPRTTPIEFLDALGGLYRSTGATATVTQIAWERFRAQAVHLTGLGGLGSSSNKTITQLDARDISKALERRFGSVGKVMEADLVAAEEACWNEKLKPRQALEVVQSLRRHEETLRSISSHAAVGSISHDRSSRGS